MMMENEETPKKAWSHISLRKDGNSLLVCCECGSRGKVENYRDWNRIIQCPDCGQIYEVFTRIHLQKLRERPNVYDQYPQKFVK